MRITVISDEELKHELLSQGVVEGTEVSWANNPGEGEPAECVFDLLFDTDTNPISRVATLEEYPLVFINDVSFHAKNIPGRFIRINGWKTFLQRNVIEASVEDDQVRSPAEGALACFQKKIEWTKMNPGFITARIVSMIINEAYFALGENVSSKNEIDLAMKLGTNYPYGPFEWAERIGHQKIWQLLKTLSESNTAYEPCELLMP